MKPITGPKRTFLCIGALAGTLCHGRIGETREQCDRRYGEAEAVKEHLGFVAYKKAGLLVYVHFHGDVADCIMFAKLADDLALPKKFSEAEIQVLWEANGGDGSKRPGRKSRWRKIKEHMTDGASWEYLGGDRYALLADSGTAFGIATVGHFQRQESERANRDRKALEGF